MQKNPLSHRMIQATVITAVLLTFFTVPFMYSLFSASDSYGLPANRPAPDFSLKNQDGQMVSLEDLRGKFVFLMFGYLNCRDICHSQALIFQEINQLADMEDKLHFLYIAMDPERDSAEQLSAYFDRRGRNFMSLRSDDLSRLQSVAGEYRSFFSREGGLENQDYEIQHTGLFFLIDPEGRLRYTYTASQRRSDLIVNDLLSTRTQQEKT